MFRRVLALLLLLAPPVLAKGTFTIGLREDPDLLDPTLGSSFVGRIVYASMCDKLLDVDSKLNLVPQLALSWHYDDTTHLILHLRPGVLFQDGEKMDAEAVRYSLMRDLTMQGSMRRSEISAVKTVEVVDPLTVRLVLDAPSAPLLSQLADRAGIIMAPKAAEAAGRQFGLHPVCAGPYAFVDRVAQDHITLRRFKRYWDAKDYHFDKVVFRPIPNAAVRLANLEAGSLDLVEYIVPTDVPAVRRDPKLQLAIGDGLAYTGITFNTNAGPRAKTALGEHARVRRAFSLSIDRMALNQVVYNGLFTPTMQANPPSSPYYFKSLAVPKRDVAHAKALLKAAGVTLPVPVVLTVSNSPDLQQAAEVIQSMAGEAGFDVKLRVVEFASGLQAGYAGDFQAYMIGWSGRVDPDGNMYQMLHTGGPFNYGRYSTPAMDKLLDEARAESDVAKRRALYRKVWTLVGRDVPLTYLWTAKNVVGLRKAVTGFVPNPDGLIRLRGVRLSH